MQAIRKAVTAIVTLAGTTAVLLAVPLLLIRIVGNPFPGHVPTFSEIDAIFRQGGDGLTPVVIGVLAVIVWALWAQVVLAFVVETVASIRRRPTPALPLLPGIQPLAARIVATIALSFTLAAGPLLAPAIGALDFGDLEPGPTTVAAPERLSSAPGMPEVPTLAVALDRGGASGDPGTRQALAGHAAPGSVNAAETAVQVVQVVLAEHTELWDLAETVYGDGVRWRDIAAENAGRPDASGALVTPETASLPSGTTVRLTGEIAPAALDAVGVALPPAFDRGVDVHVVVAGESMWSIAADNLADATTSSVELDASTVGSLEAHWSDVVVANAGVRSGDVDLIYPGERLLVPAMPVTSAAAPASGEPIAAMANAPTSASASASTPVDAAAPTPSSPASGTATPVPTSPPEFAWTPPARPFVRDFVPASPGLAGSGGTIARGHETTDTDTGDSGDPGDDMGSPDAPGETEGRDTTAGKLVTALGLGSVLLGVGVIAAVRRRRSLQWRVRAPGRMPLPVDSRAAAFEAVLAHAASQVTESALGAPWRAVPVDAVDAVAHAAIVEVVADADGRLVLASELPNAPAVDDPAAAQETPSPVTLVVGTALDPFGAVRSAPDGSEPTDSDGVDDRAVLIELEHGQHIGLVGEPAALARFTRSAVLDLAVSGRSAHDLVVIAVGCASELADLQRVVVTNDWPHAIEHAERSAALADDVSRIVIVADAPPSAAVLDQIDGLSSAVAIAPGLKAERHLVVDGDIITIEPSGVRARSAALDDDPFEAVGALVTSTALDAVVDGPALVSSPPAIIEGAEPAIEVQVLGPVDIVGASSFSSLKAVDVITYLAFHRNGADADQIKTWIWPALEPPTDKALANVMSRARSGLGVDENGEPFLARAGADRLYRLDEAIGTDFDRFQGLVLAADAPELNDRPQDRLALLRRAVDLVRGVPFSGGSATSFAWADHVIRSHVEFIVDETIHRCADLALEIGDLTSARVAVLKGVELVPGCEQCFRRRFLAARAGNNRQELRRAMADLERVASAELGEPEVIDLIPRDLLVLYEELDRQLVAGTP